MHGAGALSDGEISWMGEAPFSHLKRRQEIRLRGLSRRGKVFAVQINASNEGNFSDHLEGEEINEAPVQNAVPSLMPGPGKHVASRLPIIIR